VAEAGGRVEVESTEGRGTCIEVFFPAIAPPRIEPLNTYSLNIDSLNTDSLHTEPLHINSSNVGPSEIGPSKIEPSNAALNCELQRCDSVPGTPEQTAENSGF